MEGEWRVVGRRRGIEVGEETLAEVGGGVTSEWMRMKGEWRWKERG